MIPIKYAIVESMVEKSYQWAAMPWICKGARKFSAIDDVPNDHVLVTVHYAPWWSPLKEWIESGKKWIEIDYGYWGLNLPRRNTRRVTYCGSHNILMKEAPYSRLEKIDPPISNWVKKRGNYLLIIEPQQSMIVQRTGTSIEEWKSSTLKMIRKFWSGDVVWRRKRGSKDPNRWPEFLQQLENCYGVIGERTMACTEAAILGYQAYTLDHTVVSLLMGNKIEDILTFKTPDRTQWLNHIAWSQFAKEEFLNNDSVAIAVEQYQIF